MYKASNYCLMLAFEYISLSVCLKCWRLKSDSQHRHVLILNWNQHIHVQGIKLLSQVAHWVHFSVSLFEMLKTEIWFPAQTCANKQLESAHSLLSQVTLSRPLSVNLFEVLKTEIWFPAQTCANTQLASAHTCTRHQIIVTSYSLSTFLWQFAWSAEDWNLIWVHFSVSLLEVLKTEI